MGKARDKARRATKTWSDDDFNEFDNGSNNNSRDTADYINEDEEEEDDVEEGEYEVERVVGHKRTGRGRNGTLSYLLKWKGYDSDSNNWEKEADVHCETLVEEYWRRYEQAGGKRSDPQGDESKPAKRKAVGSNTGSSGRSQESSHGQAVAAKKRRIGSHFTDEDTGGEFEEDSEDKVGMEGTANNDNRADMSERGNTEGKNDENEQDTEVETDKEGRRSTRSTVNKEQGIPEDDEIEEYDEEEGSNWNPPENWTSWGNHIDYIRTIMQSDDTHLTVFLRWKNGCETTHDIEVAHEKFPLMLIRYYENHLRFLRIIDRDP
ncbi:hypothetical protein BG015_009010 [Linnemannia schmuckeri]|uniref:Chromo domain-containing protein n=1 Tax=Linnemannia schmuckeri TaxID=64567 RepID=A0A9P5S694_9FUNG|nr:hypothetical protein BG015_009010 [Linnemannia schmuckeri]